MLNQECHSAATQEDITVAGNLRKHSGQKIEMGCRADVVDRSVRKFGS